MSSPPKREELVLSFQSGRVAFLPVLLAVAVAGCSSGGASGAKQQAAAQASETAAIPSPAATDLDAQASKVMAAAEPFENLTESAFTTDTGKLDGLIAKAKASAAAVRPLLQGNVAGKLAEHLDQIDKAKATDSRADLAIAAVEGYRTLVSNAGGHPKVPAQVSLLDYAGFRYQADLKASPARWDDSLSALQFANDQWLQIADQVKDASLRDSMSKALEAMQAATTGKDKAAAMKASTHELDLVDGLETFFAET